MVINSKLVTDEWRCGGLALGLDSRPHARVNTDGCIQVCVPGAGGAAWRASPTPDALVFTDPDTEPREGRVYPRTPNVLDIPRPLQSEWLTKKSDHLQASVWSSTGLREVPPTHLMCPKRLSFII